MVMIGWRSFGDWMGKADAGIGAGHVADPGLGEVVVGKEGGGG